MLTYIILDLVIITVLLGLFWLQPIRLPWRRVLLVGAILLVGTALFDSLIIWANIVAYDPGKILGAYIGKAPIEDFAYVLVVMVLVPCLWKFYADKD